MRQSVLSVLMGAASNACDQSCICVCRCAYVVCIDQHVLSLTDGQIRGLSTTGRNLGPRAGPLATGGPSHIRGRVQYLPKLIL